MNVAYLPDELELIFTLAILFAIAMFVRTVLAYFCAVNYDTYGHLYYADEVKKQGVSPFGGIKTKVYGSDILFHPFLWHWLVSRFPIDIVLKKQKYIACFIESLIAIGIFVFVLNLSNELNEAYLGFFIYLFSPIFFTSLSTGPRSNSFTPRQFSEGIGFILSISLIWDHPIHNEIWFLLAVVAAVLLLISQKFGTQVVWFILPLLSLFLSDLTPIYILALANVLAIVISRCSYLHILRRHYLHSLNHFILNKSGKMPLSGRNNLRWLVNWKTLSANELFNAVFNVNSFSSIFLKYPLIFLFIFLMAIDLLANGMRPFAIAEAITISAIIIFLLTSSNLFVFLGEAERYLIYVAPATIVSVLQLANEHGYLLLVYLITICGFLFWVLEVLAIFYTKPSTRDAAPKNIIAFLNSSEKKGGVLCIPYHAIGIYRIMLETGRSVFFPTLMADHLVASTMEKFESRYPFIDLNKIDEVCKIYPIKYVIVDTKLTSSYGCLEGQHWTRLPNDFDRFIIFERLRKCKN